MVYLKSYLRSSLRVSQHVMQKQLFGVYIYPVKIHCLVSMFCLHIDSYAHIKCYKNVEVNNTSKGTSESSWQVFEMLHAVTVRVAYACSS